MKSQVALLKMRQMPDWQLYVLGEFLDRAGRAGKTYTDELHATETVGLPLGTFQGLWSFYRDAWVAQHRSWPDGFAHDRLIATTRDLLTEQTADLSSAAGLR